MFKEFFSIKRKRKYSKKSRYNAEGEKEYTEANKTIQKSLNKPKEDWIGVQYQTIEIRLTKNINKSAYMVVKDLTL